MEETMIEKMAQAIIGATEKAYINHCTRYEETGIDERFYVEPRDVARAALLAIREGLPESVIRAGDGADYECSEGIDISRMIKDAGIQKVFTAMIDAILSGEA